MARNNRTLIDLDDAMGDTSFDEEAGTVVANLNSAETGDQKSLRARYAQLEYKDQTREASVPIVSAIAVEDSGLGNGDLQRQLDEERRLRNEAEQREQQVRREAEQREQQERQNRIEAEQRQKRERQL